MTMDTPDGHVWVVEAITPGVSHLLGVCDSGSAVERLTLNIGWRDDTRTGNVRLCDTPSPHMVYRATLVEVQTKELEGYTKSE